MSKLAEMKTALKQLEELGLPVSAEQQHMLRQAEEEYVKVEVIPRVKQALSGLLSEIGHKARIIIDYDGDPAHEPDVHLEQEPVPAKPATPERYERERCTTLRVTFPDGKVLQDQGINVLMEVVKEVGPELVHMMNITCCGVPLVDDHQSNGPYARRQKPLPGNYWLMTNSNTTTKKQQIEAISRELGLGLKVEILNDSNEVVNDAPEATGKKRWKIKVTTPDGRVFFHMRVWETLRDVVLLAGIDRVEKLGLGSVGLPLICNSLTTGIYASGQHPIAQGKFLNTYSDTRTKLEQIRTINRSCNLGLKVELV